MKKIIVIGISLILLTGCGAKKEENNELKSVLKQYGTEIFDTTEWMKGGINPGTYTVSVEDMQDKLGKDISLFEKEKCDLKNTKVEFVVSEQLRDEETNYKFNYVLDC